jgi:hypothetical protein
MLREEVPVLTWDWEAKMERERVACHVSDFFCM